MFKFSHASLIFISGLIWLSVGCVLLPLGLNFIVDSLLIENAKAPHPLLGFFSPYAGGLDAAALVVIAISLLIGYVKGTRVFVKSVSRTVNRICSQENPASIASLYTPAYLVLIAVMVGLGLLLRLVPQDIRGAIDVAVGSALIHGAMGYFRQAMWLRKNSKKTSCETL